MNLVGRSVRIRLLPQAVEALNGIAQVRELTEAVVVDEDQLSIWISLPGLGTANTVALLRWEYFSTMVLEYEPEAPAARPRFGFRTH
jgi:hypothetical protein